MEIKIKVGNNKIKFDQRDFLNAFNNSPNPFDSVITKTNMELYYKFLENMPYIMEGYFNEFSRFFSQFADFGKPGIGKIPDDPDVLPANGHDIFNYIARYGIGNYQIQAILKLDGRIDFDKLKKAVRFSVDTEPVLGCRFVEHDPPYFKRLKDIDKITFCSLEEAVDADAAIVRFIESRMDMDHDPMVKVKLIRCGENDIIGIKLNHTCLDGTGIKEYMELLKDLYSNAYSREAIPAPGSRGRRDQDRLFESLGVSDPEALWIPGSDLTIPTWEFPWKHGTSSTTRYVILKLPQDLPEKMKSFAKIRGATINDLLLTAYYRAMLKMGKPVYGVPMGISVTVDLRRYLPDNKTEGLRNFSGSVNTCLSMIENEAFGDTLARVVQVMSEIKKGYPGLQSAVGLERLEKISFSDTLAYYQATYKVGRNLKNCNPFYGKRSVPTLSNLGIISKEQTKFGDKTILDAYIIPPVVSAPGILLEVGTYNGTITMAAGFFENTVHKEVMETLLNNIKDELVEGCRG